MLCELMNQSNDWFEGHAVNKARTESGKLPATNIWLWGLGRRPNLTPFKEVHGISGAMITAVDLLRGLASLIGWDRVEVPGRYRLYRHRLCGQRKVRDRHDSKIRHRLRPCRST